MDRSQRSRWADFRSKSGGRLGRAVAGKTAMNIWSCLTSSFKAATSGKRRDLRVLDGKPNPCLGVEPPGDRESRQVRRKTFLYPREAEQLLACATIELPWRELFAVALYTYLRPGELRVLTWADNGVRRVPIEPTLVPLLELMAHGRAPTDVVVPLLHTFGDDHLAERVA